MPDEIPTEALEAAARDVFNAQRHRLRRPPGEPFIEDPWATATEAERRLARAVVAPLLDAAAPYLIAEGRRQGIAQVFAPKAREFNVAFDKDGRAALSGLPESRKEPTMAKRVRSDRALLRDVARHLRYDCFAPGPELDRVEVLIEWFAESVDVLNVPLRTEAVDHG